MNQQRDKDETSIFILKALFVTKQKTCYSTNFSHRFTESTYIIMDIRLRLVIHKTPASKRKKRTLLNTICPDSKRKVADSELLREVCWKSLSLIDPFIPFDTNTWQAPQYRRKGDMVEVRGMIMKKSRYLMPLEVIAILPSLCRPTLNTAYFLIPVNDDSTNYIFIRPNGEIVLDRQYRTEAIGIRIAINLRFSVSR